MFCVRREPESCELTLAIARNFTIDEKGCEAAELRVEVKGIGISAKKWL